MNIKLWLEIMDLGHRWVNSSLRVQITLLLAAGSGNHAQFRILTIPLDLQVSHFHADGEEN